MPDDNLIPYRVGVETSPTAMLLALAEAHGIREEVAELVTAKAQRVAYEDDELGPLLSRHRKAYGYTMHDVHERSRISRSQISFYEGANAKNPGLRTVQALAYGYRLPFIRVMMAALNEINPRMNVRKRMRD